MKRLILALLLLAPIASAATRDNDDSCDIAQLPAATLLLPYFEVDLDDIGRGTTIFSIVNVTNADRIAHVTLWTDRAYPVLDFNVYLTGYDVQAINLYDVLARGIVGTEQGTGLAVSKRGRRSVVNAELDLSACGQLPGRLDADLVARVRRAFTEGIAGECQSAGGVHARAIGYATIDVVGSCAAAGPADPQYWTRDLRYDNVLTGDWQYAHSVENSALGSPLVHIRAVPEGGTPQSRRLSQTAWDAGFARTFYGRYQPAGAPRLDGRQPLPSQFAARWIGGGTSDFRTSLHVWRETATPAGAACAEFTRAQAFAATDLVVFDENENAAGITALAALPAVSAASVADDRYPQLPNGASAGWMYLNLDAGADRSAASQNWVTSTMSAFGRFSTAIDASALGNGCSAPAAPSEVSFRGGAQIGPAPDGTARPGLASTGNADSCDIAQLPAATLLLPYFEVDLANANGEKTLFTVTNTGPRDQLARVTLWTDYAYPVITFNVYLTGYDVQSINLYDVIARGVFPATGFFTSARGTYADPNAALDLRACGSIGGTLDQDYVVRMQSAFTIGRVPDFRGNTEGCDEVGSVHRNAIGYATIDVVRNCNLRDATHPGYWSEDIAFDNVLTGDYQQVDADRSFAGGSPMVHIRAIEEGLDRTFYSRHQPGTAPTRDRRQPLPSTFAVRWIMGTAWSFETHYKIWREAVPERPHECGEWNRNVSRNSFVELVRFDENENAVGDVPICRITCIGFDLVLPTTSRTSVMDSGAYPQLTNGAPAGWMYFNLDNSKTETRASQNWVIASMRAENRYSADFDATPLGNGCSPQVGESEITTGTAIIGPAPNRSQ